jgi:hypothetical protein
VFPPEPVVPALNVLAEMAKLLPPKVRLTTLLESQGSGYTLRTIIITLMMKLTGIIACLTGERRRAKNGVVDGLYCLLITQDKGCTSIDDGSNWTTNLIAIHGDAVHVDLSVSLSDEKHVSIQFTGCTSAPPLG